MTTLLTREATPAPPGDSARSSRLPSADALTLFAVGLVVVIVSLPRIRTLALHENESDAIQTVHLLSNAVFAADASGDLGVIFQKNERLKRRLEDVEILKNGRILRRHGYLFDVVETPTGSRRLRAWPWRFGETGYGAFVLNDDRQLIGDANSDARWSGLERPPQAPVFPNEGRSNASRTSSWQLLDAPDGDQATQDEP